VTWGGVVVVVQVVVPHQFFTRRNVADREQPHPAFDLIDFAVGIARVIQIGTKAVSIDDSLPVLQPIEVSARRSFVATVGFFGGDALALIFDDARSFADGGSRINPNGMDG
jgi:hypothetical protein